MKKNYESPVAEVINFVALEQMANLELDLGVEDKSGLSSGFNI